MKGLCEVCGHMLSRGWIYCSTCKEFVHNRRERLKRSDAEMQSESPNSENKESPRVTQK